MPYETTWNPSGVVIRFYGTVTAAEAIKSNEDLYGDARFDTLRYQIADFLDADEINFDETTIRQIAAMDCVASGSNPQIRVALVTKVDKMCDLAIAYQINSESSPWSVGIFGKHDDARQWVNNELPPLQERA